MTTATTTPNPFPDVPLPAGADFGDIWEGEGDDVHRVVMGDTRGITDTDVIVWTSAIQYWDGSIDTDGEIEKPALHIDAGAGADISSLNSDQARELAAALLEAAAEL
ncbi:MAG TPA: hypothetical protein VGH54_06775, partial [Mycobacterium sp.]|uniref:hypothetical protein n=1 Tax=Mycobacterium sp. TaxID=1785 RepID=UPI002F407431